MRKPVDAICEQQIRRSAFAQSAQHLVIHFLDNIIPIDVLLKISQL